MARNKGRHQQREKPPEISGRPSVEPSRPLSASVGRKRPTAPKAPKLPSAWVRYPASLAIVWHIVGLLIAPMAVSVDMVSGQDPIPGSGVISPELQELPAGERASGTTPSAFQPSPITSSPENQTATSPEEQTPPVNPLALPTPPVLRLALIYRPYLDALFLNHGYHFFAPDPMPTHLFEYSIERSEGEPITGRFPDIEEHWPRLLYHRHFMLAEQVGTVSQVLPDSIEPVGAARAYAKHLLRVHDGTRVYLRYIEHRFLTPGQVLAGTPLDAKWTYDPLGDLFEPPDPNATLSGRQTESEPIAIPQGPTGR